MTLVEAMSCTSTAEVVCSRVVTDESVTIPSHPLGIKPAGNAYAAPKNIKLAVGHFSALPDDLLVQILEILDAASLKQLGITCKSLYAFSRLDDLWKTLCVEYESLPFSLELIQFLL